MVAAKASILEDAARADVVFRALASAPRREILRALSEAERNERWAEEHFGERAEYYRGVSCCAAEVCSCCISDWLGLSASTVSHHMHRLLEAGLITSRKEGLWVYYRLERGALEATAAALIEL